MLLQRPSNKSAVQPLLGLCMPLLEQCDSMLADWYCKQKKILSVAELTRMQTFVTR